MGLFSFLKRGSLENPGNSFTEKNIWDIFDDNKANVTVSSATILNLSAVWACNRVLSESIASPPIHVYDSTQGGIAKNHPIDILLHNSVNEFLTSFSFREIMQTYLNLWGNAYAHIKRDTNGQIKGLEVIHPEKVTIKVKNQVWYDINGRANLINARDMIHIPAIILDPDSYKGVSPILYGKEMFANGLSLQQFANTFFGNNTNLGGLLTTEQALKPETLKRLADSWNRQWQGIKNSNKTGVLEQGLKYQRIGIEPEAAQFLGSREFAVEEIARWFRVPPHMIADLRRATFSNIEHQSIQFVTHTLLPWVQRWEQELNRKLFSEEGQKRYYIKFNLEGFLRGDGIARSEYYTKMFNMGSISQNEIRQKEELPPIEGGDRYYVPMNMTDSKNINTQGDEE
jgi:HK97 family phage portal protein